MSNEQKRFNEILQDFSNAMLITVGSDGVPTARPMRIAEVAENSTLWFVTSYETEKVGDIQNSSTVGVTLQGGNKFLSLSGNASLCRETKMIDELWSEAWKIWFPDGKTDPSITLIKVEPTNGEYWDHSGSQRLRYLYEAGKAYFSGVEIDTKSLGGNEKVNLA